MSTSFETLREILESHNMTVADLEYIVKYLTNENISPQLAMRRIKSFEALKTKLEDTSSQQTITELEEELAKKEKLLEDELAKKERLLAEELAKKDQEVKQILDDKSSLESEKNALENLSDLFESEREELRNQLNLMQEMSETAVVEEVSTSSSAGPLIESVARFQIDLQELIREKSDLQSYLFPITEVLQNLIDNPQNYSFNQNKYISHLPIETEKVKPSQPVQRATVSQTSSSNLGSTPKKSIVTQKPEKTKIKPGPSDKVLQILNLFLDFVGEAKTDKDFKNRVETICDMDEAYEHMGGIGLSQLYSFASKDLSKKDELVKLIEAWKIDGVPR